MNNKNIFKLGAGIFGFALLLAWLASFPLPLQQTENGLRMDGPLPVPPGPFAAWISLGLWWAFLATAILALVSWTMTLNKRKVDEESHHHIHHA